MRIPGENHQKTGLILGESLKIFTQNIKILRAVSRGFPLEIRELVGVCH
jgi:hypothetical protein